MNPYLAGIGLGLVLFISFVTMGQGLGVSGAIAKISSTAVGNIPVDHIRNNEYLQDYNLAHSRTESWWILFEVIGLFIGGYASARMAGRRKKVVMKSESFPVGSRLQLAFWGGLLMGIGSRLGRGCTSGQALTGGALLNAGSWVFLIAIFIGGYLMAGMVKRQWT